MVIIDEKMKFEFHLRIYEPIDSSMTLWLGNSKIWRFLYSKSLWLKDTKILHRSENEFGKVK